MFLIIMLRPSWTVGIKLRNQIKVDTKKGKTRKPMEIISDNYDKAGASDGVKKVLDEQVKQVYNDQPLGMTA